jgi:hypothetical protein
MKRKYGKPEVTFENFSLSANIARSCGDALSYHDLSCVHYSTHGDEKSCFFFENGVSVFHDVAICDLQPVGGRVCYHVIIDEMKAFSS